MKLGPIDYASATPPTGYRCTACGRHGCKLWREGYTFSPVEPLCCDCTAKRTGKDVSTLDERGRVESEFGRTDQIGGWLPAVPHPTGGWWSYTSVSAEGCAWWDRLPNRPFEGEIAS